MRFEKGQSAHWERDIYNYNYIKAFSRYTMKGSRRIMSLFPFSSTDSWHSIMNLSSSWCRKQSTTCRKKVVGQMMSKQISFFELRDEGFKKNHITCSILIYGSMTVYDKSVILFLYAEGRALHVGRNLYARWWANKPDNSSNIK